jgi:hypothetical protein
LIEIDDTLVLDHVKIGHNTTIRTGSVSTRTAMVLNVATALVVFVLCLLFRRGMVSDTFTRDHIEALRPKLIKTIEQSIDNMIAAGKRELPVDLVAEFALLVPTLVRES